jgi:hypothetical protein
LKYLLTVNRVSVALNLKSSPQRIDAQPDAETPTVSFRLRKKWGRKGSGKANNRRNA